MKKIFLCAFFILGIFRFTPAQAEYVDQLRAQVKEAESAYLHSAAPVYFRNMGIIARKADDAQQYELLAEIISQSLFGKMDAYITQELKQIEEMLELDALSASSKIAALLKTERYYEPSADYLETLEGKSYTAELARLRQETAALLGKNLTSENLAKAIGAYQKSGLFFVKGKQPEDDLNALHRKIGCTVGWKSKISFSAQQKFKTDYERGIVTEKAELTLRTPASDYAAAEWRGPWIYGYTGQEGTGQGDSEAILKVLRGQHETEILITAARLSSTGRFNFPVTLTNTKRLVTLTTPLLLPKAEMYDETFALTGCEDEVSKTPAKTETKTGRVLLG